MFLSKNFRHSNIIYLRIKNKKEGDPFGISLLVKCHQFVDLLVNADKNRIPHKSFKITC